MKRFWRTGALGFVMAVVFAAAVVQAADFPPTDHGGGDVVLSTGDIIWGTHTGVNQFTVLPGATVFVKPFDGTAGSGRLEVHAGDIMVSGTIVARGAGLQGGAGGGGGGGVSIYGFSGSLSPGRGGLGGSSGGLANDGTNGGTGSGSFGTGAAGGNGGRGGQGAGFAGGSNGVGGLGRLGADGSPGGDGGSGGYLIAGGNGDTTSDLDVFMGSGGGGGGGGAGGGGGDPGIVGKIAGGGGGGGGGGGNGGGAVLFFGTNSLVVNGVIDTRGTAGTGNGLDGQDAVVTLLSALGGDGGPGSNSSPIQVESASIDPSEIELSEIDFDDVPVLGVSAADREAQTLDDGFGGRGGIGVADRAIGIAGSGGDGGTAGVGGGGGMLFLCLATSGMDLTGAALDARGGSDSETNGGTIKIFFQGGDPTLNIGSIQAGRILMEGVLPSKYWQLYR